MRIENQHFLQKHTSTSEHDDDNNKFHHKLIPSYLMLVLQPLQHRKQQNPEAGTRRDQTPKHQQITPQESG